MHVALNLGDGTFAAPARILNSSWTGDADDTASWVTAITTIANYALLIVVGFLRDLLCGKGRTEVEGYAPLLNDWQVSLRCPRRIPT